MPSPPREVSEPQPEGQSAQFETHFGKIFIL